MERTKKGERKMKFRGKKLTAVLLTTALTVLSVCTGAEGKAMAAEKDTVTIHYQCEWGGANIYYWNQDGGCNNPVDWPGTAMYEGEDG